MASYKKLFCCLFLFVSSTAWSDLKIPKVNNQFCSLSFNRISYQTKTHQLIKKFEEDTDRLYPTSGFKNKDELISTSQRSASAGRALKMLLNEEVEIVMAVPEINRDLIAQKGFLNFRESGNSQGSVIGRDLVEANYSGMSLEDYQALDTAIKPKYAYVGPKQGLGLSHPEGVSNYGSDRFIFDLDKVKDRLTFTIGDSLNRHNNYTSGNDHLATHWDQRFTPWNKRELAAPAIAKGLEENKLGLPISTFTMSPQEILKEFEPSQLKNIIQLTTASDESIPVKWAGIQTGVTTPAELKDYTVSWDASLDYIEAQIWDKLTLDDVRAFEYTDQPPAGEFLKELQKRGIEIRDGRKK